MMNNNVITCRVQPFFACCGIGIVGEFEESNYNNDYDDIQVIPVIIKSAFCDVDWDDPYPILLATVPVNVCDASTAEYGSKFWAKVKRQLLTEGFTVISKFVNNNTGNTVVLLQLTFKDWQRLQKKKSKKK